MCFTSALVMGVGMAMCCFEDNERKLKIDLASEFARLRSRACLPIGGLDQHNASYGDLLFSM